MNILERVAYLKGLIKGLEIDESKKEGKVLLAMLEVIDDMALAITDIEESQAELQELVDIIDEDLGEVEEDLYDDDDDDDDCGCGCCDDELFEIECPSCGESIVIDEDMLDDGEMECPSCEELLEFDIEDLEDEDDDEDEKEDKE